MNFRGALIIGFIVIAAFTLPIVTFAEKGGQAQNPQAEKNKGNGLADKVKDHPTLPNKPEVQLPDKANEIAEKGNNIPEHALDKAKKAKKLPSQASETAKETVKKVKKESEAALKATKKKSDEVKRAVKKTPSEDKGTAVKKNHSKQKINDTVRSNQKDESSEQKVEEHNNSTEKINSQPVKNVKAEVVSGNKEQSVKAKTKSKQKKNPFHHEKSHDVKVIPFSSNSNVPNTPVKDRTGNGHSSIGLLDKWLWKADSNTYLKPINPFVLTKLEYRDQWVNAPPSPPPKATPFF